MPKTKDELRKRLLRERLQDDLIEALRKEQWQAAEDLIRQNNSTSKSKFIEDYCIPYIIQSLHQLYLTTEPVHYTELKKILGKSIDNNDGKKSRKTNSRSALLYEHLRLGSFENANKIFNHGVRLNCTPEEVLHLLRSDSNENNKINDPLWNSLMSAAGGSDVVLAYALSQEAKGIWLAKICHARGVTLTNDKAVDELLKLSLDKTLDKSGTLFLLQRHAPELINFLKELKAIRELNEALADYEKRLDAAYKLEMTGKPLSKKAVHAGETLQDVRTLKSKLDSKNPASLAKFGEAFEKIDAKLSKIESPIWKKIKRIWKQITNPAWRQERKDHMGKHHGLWNSHREVFLERVKKNLSGPTRGKK